MAVGDKQGKAVETRSEVGDQVSELIVCGLALSS